MDSVFPQYVDVGRARVSVQDLARRARLDADISVDDWKNLSALERDMWLVAVAHTMRAEAERGFDA